ncbi:DUF155 domain containing protein [Niveomyces insectorum RCEF 264]|uniref:DUF155 domain containing protein n=1 Tax=Niveomyces insectorum RCEF 264 TaxID=1081102 RepID=A0A167MAL2_9HYPO|nr:DUF155 domain containing protein [Niveomyces insectorum RCEF 264]
MATATQGQSESSPLLQNASRPQPSPQSRPHPQPQRETQLQPPLHQEPPLPARPSSMPSEPPTSHSSPPSSAVPVPPASPTARVEADELLRNARPKAMRTVTFHPNPVSRTIDVSPSSSPPTQPQTLPHFRHRSVPSATAATTTPTLTSSVPVSYGTASAASRARSAIGGGAAGPGVGGGNSGGGGGGPPVLAAINSRLRRRNSYGAGPSPSPGQHVPLQPHQQLPPATKLGPQRSTKNAQKLKLLPNPELEEDELLDEEAGRDVYSQYTRIKDPTARRDAALLGKADRARLPRVTAYCTANRYEMDNLLRFLKGRGRTRGASPKLIDECIYTPYNYDFGKSGNSYRSNHSHGNHHSFLGDGRAGARRQQRQQGDETRREQAGGQNREETTVPTPLYSGQEGEQHAGGEADTVDAPARQRQEDLIDFGSGDGGEEGGGGGGGGEENIRRDHSGEAMMGDHDAGSRPRSNNDNASNKNGRFYEQALVDDSQQQYVPRQPHAEAEKPGSARLLGDLERHNSADERRDEFEAQLRGERPVDFDIHVHTPELFLFDYGVVVIWGMSAAQEQRFLKELAKFETEKLAPADVEAEFFNFYYTREYQARIYNDFIALRDKHNYMTKLAISHALAQSVKTSLFEELIATTIDTCKDIPAQIALTGTIALSRTQINMQIGELFILRINIHLNGSVLDTPELFWVEPQLEPVYQAVRSYLEMDQRVGLLTQRLDVIADLLAVLKEQLSHGHGEKLEWIVIVLIAAEILVAAINIVVDLYAGV